MEMPCAVMFDNHQSLMLQAIYLSDNVCLFFPIGAPQIMIPSCPEDNGANLTYRYPVVSTNRVVQYLKNCRSILML